MRARFTSAVAISFAYQIIPEWNKSDSTQNEKIWWKMINSDAFGREKRIDLREKDIEFINKVENRCFCLSKAAVIWENSQGYWVRDLHFEARKASNKKTFLNTDASDSIGKWYEIEIVDYFYSRNPLMSLIRDKMVLQLQLITPGSASMTVCRKRSISSLDEATACTCSLSLPVTR